MRLFGLVPVLVSLTLLSACANHPVDCAVGFHHADCLPGTAGYDSPDKFSVVDDKQCQSYGLKPGTDAYANCRIKLSGQHDKGIIN
jgi:hypothetical protein